MKIGFQVTSGPPYFYSGFRTEASFQVGKADRIVVSRPWRGMTVYQNLEERLPGRHFYRKKASVKRRLVL